MDENRREQLIRAYKKEKNSDKKKRIHAVCAVKINKMTPEEVINIFFCDSHMIRNWIQLFENQGVEGLVNRPRSSRPTKINQNDLAKLLFAINYTTIPKKKLKEIIYAKLGVSYHITSVRRIMHKFGLSAKTSQHVHTNKADIETIRKWQNNTKRRISHLEKTEFVTVIQDESFFMHDSTTGRKYWLPTGQSVITGYSGRHQKVVAYGAISTDGCRFFRTYAKFDGATFLVYLKLLQRHFGKITIIMDSASPHISSDVRKFIAENRDIRIIHILTATPELDAIEEYWHQAKRNVTVSEYYATFSYMKQALSKHLRTARCDIDVMKYISRRVSDGKRLLIVTIPSCIHTI